MEFTHNGEILADCLRSAGKGPNLSLSLCISLGGLYQPCFVFLMPSEDAIRTTQVSQHFIYDALGINPAGKDIGAILSFSEGSRDVLT